MEVSQVRAQGAQKADGGGASKTRINTEWHADDIFQTVIEIAVAWRGRSPSGAYFLWSSGGKRPGSSWRRCRVSNTTIEERFSDLDYPGRRKPVNRDAQATLGGATGVGRQARPTTRSAASQAGVLHDLPPVPRPSATACSRSVRGRRSASCPPAPFRSPRTKKPVAAGRSDKGSGSGRTKRSRVFCAWRGSTR